MAGSSSRSSTTAAGFDVEPARGSGDGFTNMADRMAGVRRHALRRFHAGAGHDGPRKPPGRDASSEPSRRCLQPFGEVLERLLVDSSRIIELTG